MEWMIQILSYLYFKKKKKKLFKREEYHIHIYVQFYIYF
jgi:hypothetical protein